jgi:hypothetical protein
MSYYAGNEFSLNDLLGEGNPRYFYALTRSDPDGTLYFYKADQLTSTGTLTLNNPGAGPNNFENFEYGVDFFDGRNAVTHARPYPNLAFDQYRWDNKNCFYYIETNTGELIVRINQTYTYSPSQIISST